MEPIAIFGVAVAVWFSTFAAGKLSMALRYQEVLGRPVWELLATMDWVLDSRWRLQGVLLLVWLLLGAVPN